MADPVVNPIYAREGEIVEIHWRLSDGRLVVQKVTSPAKETT